MKQFSSLIQIVVQYIRPLLAGLNLRLVLKAFKIAYDLMVEVEKQRSSGDGKFTNDEKAAWVKEQLKSQTSLPDSVIDFIFGVVIARFVSEKREKAAASAIAREALNQ